MLKKLENAKTKYKGDLSGLQKEFQVDNARTVVEGKGSEITERLENNNYNKKDIPVKYVNRKANEIEKLILIRK